MDITGILLATVVFMYLFSGPRGRNRYYPLGYGVLLAALAVMYATVNDQALYYGLAAAALAKGYWMFIHWHQP